MATDEPDSDAVSEGLRQLRRTRGGTAYAPPSSPEGAGGRRPRPTKSSSAPAGTRLGAGQQKFVEESPEAQKVKGTVLLCTNSPLLLGSSISWLSLEYEMPTSVYAELVYTTGTTV